MKNWGSVIRWARVRGDENRRAMTCARPLHEALEETDDPEVAFHIRQTLQHLIALRADPTD